MENLVLSRRRDETVDNRREAIKDTIHPLLTSPQGFDRKIGLDPLDPACLCDVGLCSVSSSVWTVAHFLCWRFLHSAQTTTSDEHIQFSIGQTVCLSVWSVWSGLSVCLSFCLPVFLSFCLSVSVGWSFCLCVCVCGLPVCLSVCLVWSRLFVCLVCLSV